MNIVFKSKRELYAISVGITLLLWGALSMVLIMLLSMGDGGIVTLDFNAYGELWFEFPFAVGITIFGCWLVWFVAKKSWIGHASLIRREKDGYIAFTLPESLIREWKNDYDEWWDDA